MRKIALVGIFIVALVLVGCAAQARSTIHKAHAKPKVQYVYVPRFTGNTLTYARASAVNQVALDEDSSKLPSSVAGLPSSALTVISQSPVADAHVKKGTIVSIVLGLGQVSVPDEVGSQCSDAKADLAAAGLTSSASCDPDEPVLSQAPKAGAEVTALSSVALSAPVPMVIYTVTGNGGYSNVITFTKPGTTDIEQAANARLPWRASFPEPSADAFDNFESVSAQDENGTSISCTITDNGTVIDHETATGRYAIVQCSNN